MFLIFFILFIVSRKKYIYCTFKVKVDFSKEKIIMLVNKLKDTATDRKDGKLSLLFFYVGACFGNHGLLEVLLAH